MLDLISTAGFGSDGSGWLGAREAEEDASDQNPRRRGSGLAGVPSKSMLRGSNRPVFGSVMISVARVIHLGPKQGSG
jgi:hypothetical protein